MNKRLVFRLFSMAALAAALFWAGCRKDGFDQPPVGGDVVNLTPNTTVAALKALHTLGGLDVINDDLILAVTVTADDKSGNFYKQLYVQDETGGMEISINSTNLYASYPIGRKIFVKCQGLVLGDGDNTVTLGGYVFDNSLQGIVQALVPKVIFKGESNHPVDPIARKLSDISSTDYGMLITLQDVEIAKADTGKTYADAIGKASANRQLVNCSSGKITLRSSGYATFAGEKVPSGHGSVTGILTRFGSTDQIFIRDLSDVKMDSARCGSGGTGTGNLTLMDIADLRDVFSGSTTTAPVDKKIRGIVISDRAAGNITSKNMVIQDATGGIVVRFTASNTFNLGDEVEVNISGMELSEFSKLLQLNNVPNANAALISTGKTVLPKVATVSEIIANHAVWESTLVQVLNATFTSSGATLGTTTSINDGTATITVFTNSTYPLASTPTPTGPKKVTAIVSEFTSGKQLNLRNAADIQ